MVEFNTKVSECGLIYIPKEIRDCFGRYMRIIPGTRAVLLYPEGSDYEDLLASMEIIHKDITNRIVLRKKGIGEIKT